MWSWLIGMKKNNNVTREVANTGLLEGGNMIIIIEVDKRFTFGIDWLKKIKGIRLGFIAIHFIFANLDEFVECYKERD